MTVPIWVVPVVAAAVAAWPVVYAARLSRRTAVETHQFRQFELTISGLTTLLAETQTDRKYCWEVVASLRDEIRNETRNRRGK